MNLDTNIYKLIVFHILIGFVGYIYEPIIQLFVPSIFFFFLYIIIKNKNKDNEVLYFSAYFVGAECFFRMTNSLYFYETAKYVVMIYMSLGMFYKKFTSVAVIYLLIMLFFLPGVVVALPNFNEDSYVRKQIVFNLLGPIALTFGSIYCYNRTIFFYQFKNILLFLLYPLIIMLTYIILYTPKQNSYSNAVANSNASGGFGPNQVATLLGLGCFICFILFLFNSNKNKLQKLVFVTLFFLFFYRCILTFSRGGLYVVMIMIIIFLINTYFKVGTKVKFKIKILFIGMMFFGICVFYYSIIVTSGYILKRYQNKTGAGVERLDKFSGRKEIAESEIEIFLKNPVFGCGIGLNRDVKREIGATVIDAHNEITRLMAEQGIFGIIIFLFLFFIPMFYLFQNKNQIFALSFFIFWLLTISHSAMRIAAPGFIYALSLIKINFDENPSLPR